MKTIFMFTGIASHKCNLILFDTFAVGPLCSKRFIRDFAQSSMSNKKKKKIVEYGGGGVQISRFLNLGDIDISFQHITLFAGIPGLIAATFNRPPSPLGGRSRRRRRAGREQGRKGRAGAGEKRERTGREQGEKGKGRAGAGREGEKEKGRGGAGDGGGREGGKGEGRAGQEQLH